MAARIAVDLRSRRGTLLAAGALAAACAAVAVRLVGTRWDRANAWEAAIGVAERRHVYLQSPFARGLDVVLAVAVPLAVALLAVHLVRRTDRIYATACLVAIGGSLLTAELLKRTLGPRRDVIGHLALGYPSGHTTLAVGTALGYVLSTRGPLRLAGAAAYAVFVAVGVIVDGWHLPSDAVGGCFVALAWFLAVAAPVGARHPGGWSRRAVSTAFAAAAAVTGILLLHAGVPAHAALGRPIVEACLGAAAVATATVLAGAAASTR